MDKSVEQLKAEWDAAYDTYADAAVLGVRVTINARRAHAARAAFYKKLKEVEND